MEIIAKEVVRECGRLPLALDTIAKALKQKQINYWEDALSKLKKSIAVDIKGVTHKVHASLRLSYDYLDGDEAKILFLLCSVFPDDYMIINKDLQRMMLLESIVPKHAPTNPFNKLIVIQIKSCKQLRNLFSFSIFKGLSNLQMIKVTNCDMMDEIVSVETEDQNTISISPLISLHLVGLNKVTSFCTKPFIQQHSRTIIPFFDQQVSFPEMKNLSIHGGNNLEMLWHNDGPSASSFCKLRFIKRVFEVQKSSFGDIKVVQLRNVTLDDLPNLKYIWNKDVGDVLTFPNLKKVLVTGCPKLKRIFPASITKCVEEMECLVVVLFRNLSSLTACNEGELLGDVKVSHTQKSYIGWLVYVFGNETEHDNIQRRCGHLKKLKLKNLSNLTQVWKNMNQTTTITFFNLTDLDVSNCNGMTNLFSSSMVKNLVNLENIKIYGCRGITSIVAVEEEENGEIILNKLTSLELNDLPRLNMFSLWKRHT
ncbi:disease resistance protein SUMM2-like [Benincasa hispida]|uniref:disease resistance protein SUMM2-like n=1 Tax=Benincasa hispida TaxID=102211 RepID=UPI0018FF9A9A|nr:disease resistance protein SUMM2-like [Benincasa hispida]